MTQPPNYSRSTSSWGSGNFQVWDGSGKPPLPRPPAQQAFTEGTPVLLGRRTQHDSDDVLTPRRDRDRASPGGQYSERKSGSARVRRVLLG